MLVCFKCESRFFNVFLKLLKSFHFLMLTKKKKNKLCTFLFNSHDLALKAHFPLHEIHLPGVTINNTDCFQ